MTSADCPHIPVMVEEALALLQVRPGGTFVDATAGSGGHSERIAAQMGGGSLIALDRDADAVTLARGRLAGYPHVVVVQANYSSLRDVLRARKVEAVDGVLIDAGMSTMQLDDPERGFSFQQDGPLDMRMDRTEETDAAIWLSRATLSEIEQALREYGDIKAAGRIARVIVARRDARQLNRTGDLVKAVCDALSFVKAVPVEVRTVFQAVRMAVNRELAHLDVGVREAVDLLAPGGRCVVITFHSGEDRVVKQAFRSLSRPLRQLAPDGRTLGVVAAQVRLVLRKPLTPSRSEIERNPRAKSARLRAVERISPDGGG